MRFIKGHVYSCTFGYDKLIATFYGVYLGTIDGNIKQFKYLNCENYGQWDMELFTLKMLPEYIFTDLGTAKRNPQFFI